MYKKFIVWYVIAALGALPLCGRVCGADKAADKSVEVRTLSLAPAAEPVPALATAIVSGARVLAFDTASSRASSSAMSATI